MKLKLKNNWKSKTKK